MDKEALQKEITKLESKVTTMQENLDSIKQTLQNLKDLAWEKESKKESSKMYKVLENEKPSTIVKSNVGDIVVDREFMEKEITKHLDNPALRGMVTTEELLSYPKVARGVEPNFNQLHKSYTWQIEANDGSKLKYGSRKYEINGQDKNRLLTSYSQTERGERNKTGVGEQGQPHHLINDLDFLRPAERIITHNTSQINASTNKDSKVVSMKEKVKDIVKNKTPEKDQGIGRER